MSVGRKPMQVSFSVPTFHKTKTSDGFAEPEVPVTVKLEQGIRLVLGKDDDDSFVPHILIERRSRGWLVFLHPDGTEESCGYLFINDNGRSFVIPGNRFGCAEAMECASLKQFDAIEATINPADEPQRDEAEFIDTAEERAEVTAEKDEKNNLFGPDLGEPR